MRHPAPAAFLLSLPLSLGLLFAQDGPESVTRGTKQFRKAILASGLAGPWEIAWGPDNQLWITERTGKRVIRMDPATGERKVAITIDEVSAPGGQDGLLGMALHPELLKGTGNDYVYVYYTYVDKTKKPDPYISDPASPWRHLYGKLVRLTYNPATGSLSSPVDLITGLPAGNDHNAGRVKIGPDKKIYFTIGDQGNNQLGNFCIPVEAQRLPTKKEMAEGDYASYVGKVLRANLDGSVPKDNPKLKGVVSHIFTYGHRNPQGLDFAPDGTIYSTEHGPKTDDEVNVLQKGGNYGWPNVAGLKDNKAYEYARWSEASTPCSQLKFNDIQIHPSVPRQPESAFTEPMVSPIATMFTVPTGYNFEDPACKGIDFICWPTVGVSSVEHYQSKAIPGWDRILIISTLKRGSIYILPLTPDGKRAAGRMSRYFQAEDRYRDTAVSPDGRTIYVATDPDGLVEAKAGGATSTMQTPGAILTFTYEKEGTGLVTGETQTMTSKQTTAAPVAEAGGGAPVQFTAAQSAAGKTAYNASCAVCHGNTLTNGTFGTPLAGDYFQKNWSGKSVRSLVERAHKTMPPAAPGSLDAEVYRNIVTYILEVNGAKAGASPLPADPEALSKMSIR